MQREEVISFPMKWFHFHEDLSIDTIEGWIDSVVDEAIFPKEEMFFAKVRDREMRELQEKSIKLYNRLYTLMEEIDQLGEVNGITICVEQDTGFCTWAICSKNDEFSKRTGRLLTTVWLTNHLAKCDPVNWNGRARILNGNRIDATLPSMTDGEDIRLQYNKWLESQGY